MKTKQPNNPAPETTSTDFFPEENCHVEVSERDWKHIVQVAESDEVNPALKRAALRYADRHK